MALLPESYEADGERKFPINIGADVTDFMEFVETLVNPLTRFAELDPDSLAATMLNTYEELTHGLEEASNATTDTSS